MFKDSHIHTIISHDGVSSMESYIDKALDREVDEITFTDHYDIYDDIESNLETLNVDRYFEAFNAVKDRNLCVKVNFGIEFGLQPNIQNEIKAIVEKYPFDFIIGSSHITCKKDIAKDKSFFAGLTKREAYLKYFNEVLNNIKTFDEFDVYGHLDYIIRYGDYSEKRIEYKDFCEVLDQILITLIKKGKGIEVNTSGFRYGLNQAHPTWEIIERYKELGGKIITLGSDAHCVDDMAKDFDKTIRMLKNIGIDEIAVFRKRTPTFIQI